MLKFPVLRRGSGYRKSIPLRFYFEFLSKFEIVVFWVNGRDKYKDNPLILFRWTRKEYRKKRVPWGYTGFFADTKIPYKIVYERGSFGSGDRLEPFIARFITRRKKTFAIVANTRSNRRIYVGKMFSDSGLEIVDRAV